MLTKSMNQWFLPGKKMLLAALLFFVSARAYSIIYWQAYPITAVIGTNGTQQRLECSVYDSLLGSWQYYNTPYFNSAIEMSGSSASIIVFHHPTGGYYLEKDSMYGYVIYDQELHQFAPVIEHHSDPDYPSAGISATDGIVTISKWCCEYWDGGVSEWTRDQWLYFYNYDIKSHSWRGGNVGYVWGSANGGMGAYVYRGGFIIKTYNDIDWNPETWGYYLTRFGDFATVHYWRCLSYGGDGDQDLFYGFVDGLFYPPNGYFSAFDPSGGWATFVKHGYGANLFGNGIFYCRENDSGHNFFGIYDDSLHDWKIDTTDLTISNVKIKDRVVAYTSSNTVYYEVFSPTSRTWVKDSTIVTSGIDSIYIQEGTVKWVNNNGVTHKAGYNDATGWGNYNTPLLLNFHLTDFYSSTGEPMIFVRNYSIGTDSVMYDFGDGITTGWHQSSLYHLYKVNGHYMPGGVDYNICISTYNSAGLQSSCTAVTHPCTATFNVTNSCPGACYGSINAIPQTGQLPFTYQWSNGATTSSVNSLCTGGYYAVTITDNTGCSITTTLQIIAMQLDSAQRSTCTGSCSGEASVMASNGTFPYTYLWSTADTTSTILNLCAGNYTVTVTDNMGCTKSTAVAVTNYPNSLTFNNYGDPPCCSSCADGVLDYETTGTRPTAWSLSPNIGVIDTFTYNGTFIIYIDNLPPGVYELTLTDGFGCPVVMTDTLVPIISDSVIVSGPTSLCSGGSVLLTAYTGPGSNYQWIKDGVNIPGATTQSYLAAATGNYKVHIDDFWASGCDIISDSVSVTVLPVATITPQSSTTFCQGDSVVLTVPVQLSCTYQWKKGGVNIPGATSASYTATEGGVYKVKVTNTVGGCSQITNPGITVTVKSLPSATITAMGPTTFCMGDTLVLTGPSGANKTFQWKKGGIDISGATSSSYPATTGGNYKVTVTNTVTGCSKTTATATVLTTNPQPSATITPVGPTTFCAGDAVLLKGNAGTGYSYQWKKGGNNITGATNKNYTATLGGVYKLKVVNTYGCSKLSGGVTVTVPCKEGESESEGESVFDVKVYPNPSSGDFIFETENERTEKISVSVYDMMGKLILSGDFFNSQFTIRNPQLSPGVYAATITDGKNKKVLRLVKTK